MLEFEGAVKRFGPLAALDECTFGVRPGRLTGFLGPNGAGKTTAMRAVFGLVELDAGARAQGDRVQSPSLDRQRLWTDVAFTAADDIGDLRRAWWDHRDLRRDGTRTQTGSHDC